MNKINCELLDNDITQGIRTEIFPELIRIMKLPNIYIFCNKRQILFYTNYFVNEMQYKFDLIIWHKTNIIPAFSHQYLNDVEYCLYFHAPGTCNPQNYDDAKTVVETTTNKIGKENYKHPTVKPLELIEKLIRNSSKPGDIVFDCFLGSGTTAVASKNQGRHYLGIEKNPIWYKVSCDRLDCIDANGQIGFLLK